MARTRSPDRDKAFEIYKENNGQIDLVKIAEILKISPGTIRGWKNKDKWNDKLNGTFQNEKKVVKNTERSKRKVNKTNKVKKEPIAEEVKEVLENTELTDKQRLFCVLYVKCMNATKAYLKAYTCTYESAMVNGSRLLGNDKIKEQIDKLIGAKCNKEFLSRSVIQKYIDIAFADITDYVTFGQEEFAIRDENGNIQYDEDGNIRTRKYSYVKPNESIRVDGTLITEVSQGKDGIKIKLADKMKALDFLTKHCNLLSDEEKIKLNIENKKLQNSKIELEIKNIKGDNKNNNAEDWVKAIEAIATKRGSKNE